MYFISSVFTMVKEPGDKGWDIMLSWLFCLPFLFYFFLTFVFNARFSLISWRNIVESSAPESLYPTTPPNSSTANTGGSCSSSNGASSTGSPSGVNRRTAVLFKKKLQSVSPAESGSIDFKHPANPLPSSSSGSSKRSSGGGASLSGRSKYVLTSSQTV